MSKSSRRRAREAVVQGLYQWLLNGACADAIAQHLAEHENFATVNKEHFEALLNGAIEHAESLRAALQPHLDRPVAGLSPVEHAILLAGAYELIHRSDIPYRVVINEAVEVAKTFASVEGHKYVNGVLDKLARDVRSSEMNQTS